MSKNDPAIVDLLASFTQRELLEFDQLVEFSFHLLLNPDPLQWVDEIHSRRHREDLISLLLCLQIPLGTLSGQLEDSDDVPAWRKEELQSDMFSKAQKIFQRIGYRLGVGDLEKLASGEAQESLLLYLDEDTWTGSIDVIQKNPILLSFNGDFALASMIFAAFLEKDDGAVAFFNKHRNFLAECRHSTIEKVILDRFPFVNRLHDGIREANMFMFAGIDGLGYGDIDFPDVYKYAKKIVKNQEGLISAKLDVGMGRYLILFGNNQEWERGKTLLENVLNWIEKNGDDYNEGSVNISEVQTRIFLGQYWRNKFANSKELSEIDKAIEWILSAIEIAPLDQDILAIYNGLYNSMLEKYYLLNTRQALGDVIDVLQEMLDANEQTGAGNESVILSLLAGNYSILYLTYNVDSAADLAISHFQQILELPDLQDDILQSAKSGLGRVLVSKNTEQNDLESLDEAIKNLTEALGDEADFGES